MQIKDLSINEFHNKYFELLRKSIFSNNTELVFFATLELLNIKYKTIQKLTQKERFVSLKLAFKKSKLRYHPDKNPDNKAVAEDLFNLTKNSSELIFADPNKYLNICDIYPADIFKEKKSTNQTSSDDCDEEENLEQSKSQNLSEIIDNVCKLGQGGAWILNDGSLEMNNNFIQSIESRTAGKKINIVTKDNAPSFNYADVTPDQAWIFLNLNSGFDYYICELFVKTILNAHEKGGVVFVTSNSQFIKVATQAYIGSESELPRFLRRAEELFGMRKPLSNEQKNFSVNVVYEHSENKLQTLNLLIRKNKHLLTDKVLEQLKKGHPKLIINDEFGFDIKYVEPDRLDDLLIDLQFYILHPGIALENLCCRLNNYIPITPLQIRMLDAAKCVTNLENLHEKRGEFFEGKPGIGKTHISIAVAKILILYGFETYFITPETAKKFSKFIMKANQIWIFDDLNMGYGSPISEIYKRAVLNAHEHGGMVFVTSNSNFQKLASEMYVGEQESLPRFLRRAEELFGLRASLDRKQEQFADSDQVYLHEDIKLTKLTEILKMHSTLITPAICQQFRKHYPKLTIKSDQGFDVQKLEPDRLDDLIIDLKYYTLHPNIPLENLCCRFNNYIPSTELQKKMMQVASDVFYNYISKKTSGFFFEGKPGIGKTHLSIALAKQLFSVGIETYFITPETTASFPALLKPKQFFIFDDLNSGHGHSFSELYKKAVLHVHKHGGGVFVTSNSIFEKITKSAFALELGLKKTEPYNEFLVIANKIFLRERPASFSISNTKSKFFQETSQIKILANDAIQELKAGDNMLEKGMTNLASNLYIRSKEKLVKVCDYWTLICERENQPTTSFMQNIASANYNLSSIYLRLGDLESAIKFAIKAKNQAEILQDHDAISKYEKRILQCKQQLSHSNSYSGL
jgi:hypothetical protein